MPCRLSGKVHGSGSLVQPQLQSRPTAGPLLPPSTMLWGTSFHGGHASTLPFSSVSHLFLPLLLRVWPQSALRGTEPCLFFLTFSLAKGGKFQRPELVMAGCLFWKSNGLGCQGRVVELHIWPGCPRKCPGFGFSSN